MAKYGIGWASKKARDWTNKQLEYRLKIIDKPEAILQNLNETGAYLWITVHVWSSMPLKLKLEKVMGAIETEGYEAKIDWDRTVEKISHHKIQNIEIGKNSWAFSVCVPIQVLKKRVSKSWCLTFVAVFENKAARTFTDIKFKIRDSDIKRIQETLIEEN